MSKSASPTGKTIVMTQPDHGAFSDQKSIDQRFKSNGRADATITGTITKIRRYLYKGKWINEVTLENQYLKYRYIHCLSLFKVGTKVKAGQEIVVKDDYVPSHLHLDCYDKVNKCYRNPLEYVVRSTILLLIPGIRAFFGEWPHYPDRNIEGSLNLPINQQPMSGDFYKVKTGGWRANVIIEIIKAGIWSGKWQDHLDNFNKLNPTTPQGGWKAGQLVRIKQSPPPTTNVDASVVKAMEDNLRKQKEAFEVTISQLERQRTEQLVALETQKAQELYDAQQRALELEAELEEIRNPGVGEINYEQLFGDVLKEDYEAGGVTSGIIGKIRARVEGIKSKTLRSIILFDWKYILFVFVSGFPIILTYLPVEDWKAAGGILAAIATIATAGKLFLDRTLPYAIKLADKNNDGVANLEDTEVLKNYRN